MDTIDSESQTSEQPLRVDPDAFVPSPQQVTLRRFVGVLLAVYWTMLFLATHVTIESAGPQIPNVDKLVHFVGYSVLGLLLSLSIALRRPLSFKVILGIMATIALYGIADELLQIPIGRGCELLDWVADLLGASTGVTVITVLSGHRIGR